MRKTYLVAAIALTLSACAMKSTNPDSMNRAEYQSRPVLTQSLVSGETLSEAAIQKILSSRIKLPKSIRLAVLRLDRVGDYRKFYEVDDEMTGFFTTLERTGRIREVITVPDAMVAQPANISSLRLAAVMLQADMLLVIQPRTETDWKFNIFEKDKAKARTTVEIFLIDTRTSVIPYTALISKTAEVTNNGAKDYDRYDMMSRAKLESEKLVLNELSKDLGSFVSKVQ